MTWPVAHQPEDSSAQTKPGTKHPRRLIAAPRNRMPLIRASVMIALGILALATPGFLSQPSILSLVTTVSFIGCVAVGMTLITLSGNILSFSLGAIVGATAMIFIVAVNWGGLAFGLFAALASGALLNVAQGFVIGWMGANPIIISIATLALIQGVVQALGANGTVYLQAGIDFGILKSGIAGVPMEFVTFLCSAAVGQFILSFTIFGRNVYMAGGSMRAAAAVGVRTWSTVSGVYLWAGLFSALAGIMLAIRYDLSTMDFGAGYDYEAVAAVLVGGTLIKGGEGSVVRTLLGAMIIAIIQDVLLLKGLRQEWQILIAGLIVLAVIVLQTRGAGD